MLIPALIAFAKYGLSLFHVAGVALAIVLGALVFGLATPEPKRDGVWYVIGALECSESLGVEYTPYGKLLHCRSR